MACSGDMNRGEPVIVLLGEMDRLVVHQGLDQAEIEELGHVVQAAALRGQRFAGLMSRWIRPASWASASPSHACRNR